VLLLTWKAVWYPAWPECFLEAPDEDGTTSACHRQEVNKASFQAFSATAGTTRYLKV